MSNVCLWNIFFFSNRIQGNVSGIIICLSTTWNNMLRGYFGKNLKTLIRISTLLSGTRHVQFWRIWCNYTDAANLHNKLGHGARPRGFGRNSSTGHSPRCFCVCFSFSFDLPSDYYYLHQGGKHSSRRLTATDVNIEKNTSKKSIITSCHLKTLGLRNRNIV